MANITEERTRVLIEEAIAAAVRDGGAVHAATTAVIAEQSRAGGGIHTAFSGAFDTRADAEFPYRAVLRGLSAAQWRATWASIKVDPDDVSAVMDSLTAPGSAMGQIMAFSAARPENADLAAFKQHAAMKSAPKKSWKQLCYPEQGGGPDTLQVFLSERAETSTDDNVKALARAILSFYHLIEKRYTTMQNMKKGSTYKVEGQKLALMPFVYQCIKSFKHRTVKPSACVQLRHDVLMKDFGQDLFLGLCADKC